MNVWLSTTKALKVQTLLPSWCSMPRLKCALMIDSLHKRHFFIAYLKQGEMTISERSSSTFLITIFSQPVSIPLRKSSVCRMQGSVITQSFSILITCTKGSSILTCQLIMGGGGLVHKTIPVWYKTWDWWGQQWIRNSYPTQLYITNYVAIHN